MWKIIWRATIYSLWKQRNNCIFKQELLDSQLLLQQIKFLAWSWLHSLTPDFITPFALWSSSIRTLFFLLSLFQLFH